MQGATLAPHIVCERCSVVMRTQTTSFTTADASRPCAAIGREELDSCRTRANLGNHRHDLREICARCIHGTSLDEQEALLICPCFFSVVALLVAAFAVMESPGVSSSAQSLGRRCSWQCHHGSFFSVFLWRPRDGGHDMSMEQVFV